MRKVFTIIISALLAVSTFAGDYERVLIGDLYYNLYEENKTAEVTYQQFWNNYSLTSISIPDTVEYDSENYKVTSIGEEAFYGCYDLTSVTIPNTITTIGQRAFSDCYDLTFVTIPNSVTSIGNEAFSSAFCLFYKGEATGAPWGAKYMNLYQEGSLFYDNETKTKVIKCDIAAEGEIILPNSVMELAEDAFIHCAKLEKVIMPNNLRIIGPGAFQGCVKFDTIYIPQNVDSIGSGALLCGAEIEDPEVEVVFVSQLQAIIVDKNNSHFTSVDGVLYDKAVKTLIQYPMGKEGAYIIPNTVTKVGFCAGLGSKISELTIPSSVHTIEAEAFVWSPITSIHFSEGISEIRSSAFIGCMKLKNVVLPNSITKLGDAVFARCKNLTSAVFGDGVTLLPGAMFYDCAELREVSLGKNVKSVDWSAFYFFDEENETASFSRLSTIIINTTSVPDVVKFNYSTQTYVSVTTDDLSEVFLGVSRKAYLYVPDESVHDYEIHPVWGEFDIRALEKAQIVETTDVTIVPSENSADIAWPIVSGAATYELVIKDKVGNVICSLVFNSNGQLTSIAFRTSACAYAPQQTKTIGFQFTVTGLDEGTIYDYEIISKDAEGNILDKQTGSFTTTSHEGIENCESIGLKATKTIRNGHLLIEHNGHLFNAQGARVK